MTIHQKIERLTKFSSKRGISLAAGLNPQYLFVTLKTKRDMKLADAVSIARVLGVSVGWLVDDSKGWPPVHTKSSDKGAKQAQAA